MICGTEGVQPIILVSLPFICKKIPVAEEMISFAAGIVLSESKGFYSVICGVAAASIFLR